MVAEMQHLLVLAAAAGLGVLWALAREVRVALVQKALILATLVQAEVQAVILAQVELGELLLTADVLALVVAVVAVVAQVAE
jgi:hypothetical protein